MFAALHSDINSLKLGLLLFTGHPYCINCRSAKVKDGIINFILRNYLIDRHRIDYGKNEDKSQTHHHLDTSQMLHLSIHTLKELTFLISIVDKDETR